MVTVKVADERSISVLVRDLKYMYAKRHPEVVEHIGATKEAVKTLEKMLLRLANIPRLSSMFTNWSSGEEKKNSIRKAGKVIIARIRKEEVLTDDGLGIARGKEGVFWGWEHQY